MGTDFSSPRFYDFFLAHVLVVDDQPEIRGVVTRTLEGQGHTVQAASDGAAGLAVLRQHQFDLVITDIFMPGQDGIVALRNERREFPAIPVSSCLTVRSMETSISVMPRRCSHTDEFIYRERLGERSTRREGARPRAFLYNGGSAVIGPSGKVIAGPVYDEETVLVADCDLDEITRESLTLDVSGHYSRPDIFELRLKTHQKGSRGSGVSVDSATFRIPIT